MTCIEDMIVVARNIREKMKYPKLIHHDHLSRWAMKKKDTKAQRAYKRTMAGR
jgi:hypothetical protein